MATNKELVKIFKAARQIIANRERNCICYALGLAGPSSDAGGAIACDAKDIILDRLTPEIFVEGWLAQFVPGLTMGYLHDTPEGREKCREYRLRWLDALIQEFS